MPPWYGRSRRIGPGAPAVLATDLVVDGVHVDLDLSGLDDVGYKALMVTVSDLAAMGTRPDYALVSVAAPPGTDIDRLGAGLAAAARRGRVPWWSWAATCRSRPVLWCRSPSSAGSAFRPHGPCSGRGPVPGTSSS